MMALPRNLLSLQIWEMPTLKELPSGFENAAPTIEYKSIADCSCFEILPKWLNKCTSLLGLELVSCMLLESLLLQVMRQLTALWREKFLPLLNLQSVVNGLVVLKWDEEFPDFYWIGGLCKGNACRQAAPMCGSACGSILGCASMEDESSQKSEDLWLSGPRRLIEGATSESDIPGVGWPWNSFVQIHYS
ncbi:hypothetical protein LguiB_006914 [Lonicera macranthoides]